MRRPRLLAACTAASALLLAGCSVQKPSPLVSVVSGGSTTHTEATSYCFDGQDPKKRPGTPGGCTFRASSPELLKVRAGDQVGVDVAKPLAAKAWVVVLQPQVQSGNAQQPQAQTSGVQTSHYFAFTPSFSDGPLELQVRSLASNAPGAAVTGVWRFVLAPV